MFATIDAANFGGYGWLIAGAGAVLGIVASMWSKIKGILWRFVSLFIQRIEIPTESAHEAVVAYLIAHYQRLRNYDRMYGASWEYQRDGRYGLIPYELFGSRSLVFWNGWVPFIYTNQMEAKHASNGNKGGGDTPSGVSKVYSTVTFIRGTLNVEEIIKSACMARNNLSWSVEDEEAKKKNRFSIHFVPHRGTHDDDNNSSSDGLSWFQQGAYRLLAHSPDELGKARTLNGKALDNLIFPQKVKDLIREIELWRKSKDWYIEKGIPWKRGWMLYGPPGTGKTALARAFAEDLNMPIYVYNLAEMSNHDLTKAWAEMQVNVPCIALLEDIDNVFHGRENVARKGGMFSMMMPEKKDDNNRDSGRGGMFGPPLTFDCLLNCLDGVERADGIFTVVTTNDITKIDPALGQPRKLPDGTSEFISTRPGRVDKAVELTYMEPGDKKRMAKRILGAFEKPYLEMLAFVDKYPDLQETPAQFQERCAQIALRAFWKDKYATVETQPTVSEVAEELLRPSTNGVH
ncbi:ATP-binding protein [Limnoglobus roseus]|uniref:ATP-binding protein n=2 Tax=Limnoglobus roseus TaxID=2598579 RepID=A0A5C1A8I7_9BACT|nr:ATP-binding protein [Limnoglobus roseus]